MAISRMQRLSLIVSRERLDDLLLSLQDLRGLEFRILSQERDWQEVFAEERVSLPPIHHYDSGKHLNLQGEEALNFLSKQEQHLELTIQQIKGYLPKQGSWRRLRQKKRGFPLKSVQNQGIKFEQIGILDRLSSLFQELDRISLELQNIEEERTNLTKWSALTTTPGDLEQFKHIKALIGTIPSSKDDSQYLALTKAEGIDIQEVYRTDTEYGLILFLHPRREEEAGHDLTDYGFKAFSYPYKALPKDRLEELATEKTSLLTRRSQIEEELSQAPSILEDLEVQLEYTLNLYSRQLAKKRLASSQYLVAIEAWVEEAEVGALKAGLIREFSDNILVEELPLEEADWDHVPIKLRNHPLIEPFEIVTEMYSLPRYYEKDPTPILAPFYFTFFGMMVADLGYGLLMTFLTGVALKLFHLNKAGQRFLKFFAILGVSVAIWGLIYGSFFGYTLPIQLISTTGDVMTILLLSVAFGFVTVVVGLFLGGQQKIRMKDYASAYNDGFAWCLILVGFLLLAVGKLLPELAFLASLGQWLAIANAIGILLVSIIKAKSLSGLGSGLYNLYNVSGYIGDLVSFTRLMALGLSGASIGSAFNLIIGLFPGISKILVGSLLFILLHAINIFLSLLSGYVHGARLMFVEFFGKFYEGGGRAFDPLKPSEKHITIINEVHLEDK